MRIMMLSHGYPPIISGVTLVAQKLARAMVRRGHRVMVISASELGEPYRAEDQGVEVVRVRSTRNPFWTGGPLPILSHELLKELVASFQPEAIHTHDTGMLALQLLRLELEGFIPQIATCHFLPRFVRNYIEMGEQVDRFAEAITWGYAVRMINRFDHVVFPTATQQSAFAGRGLDVPSTVISNGLDTSRYRPRQGQEPELWSELPRGPRLLFVSRLARDKNIDLLISAMPRIWSERGGHLLLVGSGDDRPRLEQLVRNRGLDHCVHFLGFVPEIDLPSLYREVDLFVIASECEVQSIPTLQAAASGLPIVAVRAGALPELVKDAVNGALVGRNDAEQLAEAVIRILSDPAARLNYSRASLRIGQDHGESRTFHSYEKLYFRQARIKQLDHLAVRGPAVAAGRFGASRRS